MLRRAALLLALCALQLACTREDPPDEATGSAPPEPRSSAPHAEPSASAATSEPVADASLVLLAGGDVSFGRTRGQFLLRDPARNDLAFLGRLRTAADLFFVNLESTISDRGGETESPNNPLVFTAPPPAAAALRRGGVDIVSLANNHAWDYGKQALLETFAHLDREGVAYVGAGTTREAAYAARVIDKNGFSVAFVAVTAVWNQELSPHPGRDHVADADREALVEAVKRARALPNVDAVIVSHHGGYEYVDQPHDGTRELARAAIAAGADAFIGHHPHVIQRVAIVDGKPVFYSLGNLLMRMATGKPWTEFGLLARLELRRKAPPEAWICPVRIHGYDAVPLADDPKRAEVEPHLRHKLDKLQRDGALVEPTSAAEIGAIEADGCAPIRPGSTHSAAAAASAP